MSSTLLKNSLQTLGLWEKMNFEMNSINCTIYLSNMKRVMSTTQLYNILKIKGQTHLVVYLKVFLENQLSS